MYKLSKHLDYNVWANSRVYTMLKEHKEELFFQETKSSFPSLAKTLMHIWDAEFIWLERFKGNSLKDWPSSTFKGNASELLEGFKQSSVDLRDFAKNQGENFMSQTITYKNIKGAEFTNSIDELIFHVVNHNAFHRGQIVTMLRSLGVENILSTDIIFFLRE
jgi:uncharacterized damage-inducible protein DinB